MWSWVEVKIRQLLQEALGRRSYHQSFPEPDCSTNRLQHPGKVLQNEAKVGAKLQGWKIGGDRISRSFATIFKTDPRRDGHSRVPKRTGPMVKLLNQHECRCLEAQESLESTDPLKEIM